MSDIERFFTIYGGGGMMPARSGDWVLYDDHRAEVERLKNNLFPWDTYDRLKNANEHLKEDVAKLTAERDEAQAEVQRLQELLTEESKSLPKLIDSMTSQLRATADRLTAERDEATTKVKRVIAERDEAKSTICRLAIARDVAQDDVEQLKEQVRALTLAVEQADEAKAHAEAAAAAKEAETDRVMSERDAAQAEVERLTVRLEHAQARIVPPLPHADESAQQVRDKMDGYIASLTTELHKTRHKLARVHAQYDEFAQVTAKVIAQHQRERDDARQQVYRLQQAGADRPTDQSAQNLDMANGQAILDSSRPTDETIWREAFMAAVHDVHKNWMDVADVALAQYRKRWPQ